MNQGLHRVVFNAVRGLRMAVAETATTTGKGHNDGNIAAAGATSTSTWRAGMFAIGWTALAAMAVVGFAVDAQAQIVPNPFGAAGQKPQVLVAPNGVPLVNITTPSAAGVSVNQYNQFDVNAAGAILNNSRTTASTQLGGLVQGNPWLATGPARIIVNQVSSSNPSYLNGYIEVAGQRAEVIIANPSGIQANGAGFINTSRATLTTGTPQYGALGTLDAFLVQGGTVTINGNGLDLSTTDYAAILSRALQVNAAIYASELKVVTGAKGAITANTQQFSNTAGGQVFSQDAVTANTNGGTYDNSGGQTQALGNLIVSGAGVDNTGGLLRSSATTTLNVGGGTILNDSTQGTNQGIEGENVVITAAGLNNAQGAIRANQNVTATVSGTVDNTNGLMSAGDTLKVADPNAANPSAKTLNVINTGGTLVADKSVVLDAATFSADGTLVSNKDLTVALTQDIVNNAEVVANGNLSYGTTGNLANNGKLLAGQTLTVSGNVVTNNASGEMSGTNTTVNAGTLDNRGLIDSAGTTRINAGVLNNIGTGRIYGDAVAIGAGQINNDTETVNGVASAGTIAGRLSVDIGASQVNNREHALIFSGGNMAIGASLDGNGKATGQGGTLNNLSATLESLGNMSIAMGQVNNLDTHLQVTQVTTTGAQTYYADMAGNLWQKLDAQGNVVTWGNPLTRTLYHRNPDGSVIVVGIGYADWYIDTLTTTDTAVNADPARIAAGGDLTINGQLLNRDSRVIAGGTLSATSVNNQATQGQQTVAETQRLALTYSPRLQDPAPVALYFFVPPTTTTVAVGAYEYVDHVNATSGYAVGSAALGSAGMGASGAGSASGGTRNPAIVEVAAKVGGAASSSGTGAGSASSASGTGSADASGSIPMVVRTSTPTASIPNASLYSTHPGAGRYLVVTDPRFAGYWQWLSSDYLLEHLGVNPDTTLQRLGDGFYEQQLIREQVAQLTGYRYLDGYSNDEDQYIALMNAGVTFAQQFGLTPGVALTPARMAQLTSDIVWLVEQTVTLPDGSTRQVLVPQVYVRVQPGDIDGSGALLAGNKVNIDGKGSKLTNTGTIGGREVVSINASTVDNLNGRISGGQVGIKAQQDINNVGGTIGARDKLVLDAGGSINVVTTTQSTTGLGMSSGTNIDRVAGLYVTGSKGVLVASAGNDINLVGAQVVNQGSGATSFKAGRDVNLSTVTESRSILGLSDGSITTVSTSKEIGSTIAAGGKLTLDADRDVTARAATVSAAGDLSVRGGNDITVESGRDKMNVGYTAQWTDKGLLSRTSNTVQAEVHSDNAIGSSFTGKNTTLRAGNDIDISGSYPD